jgi:predicted GNAT family acetyltransferase
VTLNDPDDIFHFSVAEARVLITETPRQGVRALTVDDQVAFDRFIDAAPEDDVDEAFVDLDHWLVFGCFVDDVLVSAASMYPWDDSTLADTGVLTLPDYRGRGYAAATVRALSAEALRRGYEPQYRCQVDNLASVAVARSAGLTLFGTWEVVLPAD